MTTVYRGGRWRDARAWYLKPALALLLCCAAAAQTASPAAPPVIEKEIYGQDDRIDVYQETDPDRQAWAKSVCALIRTDFLIDNGDDTYSIDPDAASHFLPLCEDQAFADQPRGAECSAFMVGDDLVATAGHCVREGILNTLIDFCSVRVVFGFEMADVATPVTAFSQDQVYSVAEVVAAAFNEWNNHDFAVLRLDRPITAPGAAPLPLRQTGSVHVGDKVGIMGHPLGLPLKLAFGADTEVYPAPQAFLGNGDTVFFTNFDACAGNSGSPVFNADTGEIEGIYTFSFVPDVIDQGDCFSVNTVPNSDAAQGVVASHLFAGIVDDARNGAPGAPVGGCCGSALKAFSWPASISDHTGDTLALFGAAAALTVLCRIGTGLV